MPQIEHLLQRVFPRLRWHPRVQPRHRLAQAPKQNHLAVIAPLWRIAIGRHGWAMHHLPARLAQPAQRFLFELVFGHGA